MDPTAMRVAEASVARDESTDYRYGFNTLKHSSAGQDTLDTYFERRRRSGSG